MISSPENYFADYINKPSNLQTLEGLVVDIGRDVSRIEKETGPQKRGKPITRSFINQQLPSINEQVAELTGWPLREIPTVFLTDPALLMVRVVWTGPINLLVGRVGSHLTPGSKASSILLHAHGIGESGVNRLVQSSKSEWRQRFTEAWNSHIPYEIFYSQYNPENGKRGNIELCSFYDTAALGILAHEITHWYQKDANIQNDEVGEGQARWVHHQYAIRKTQATNNQDHLLSSLKILGYDMSKAYLSTMKEQGREPVPEVANRVSFLPWYDTILKLQGVDNDLDSYSLGTAWALVETAYNPSKGFEAIKKDPTYRPTPPINIDQQTKYWITRQWVNH